MMYNIGDDSTFVMISHGYQHNVGICTDGRLWSWGKNNFGQLGLGHFLNSTILSETPNKIDIDGKWTAVVTGGLHSVALGDDGSLWSWGYNGHGQLGVGNTQDINIPVVIGDDNNWISFSCGVYHTLGLKQDGTLWSCGANNKGQLGLGHTSDTHRLTRIGDDNDWIMVNAGINHSIGIKEDGTLWSWGCNNYGQLGTPVNNVGNNSSIPTMVNQDTDWSIIRCGKDYTLAIKQDGSLWSWGNNNYGQLGTGDVNPRQIPTLVEHHRCNRWLSISCSCIDTYSHGTLNDGTFLTWGRNH